MHTKALQTCSEFVKITLAGIFFLLLSSTVYAEKNAAPASIIELQLVFSADYGKGEQVYISKYVNGDWTAPVQISQSDGFVLHPVSSTGNDGKIWVIWTQTDKKGKFLYYSVSSDARWSKPEKIKTTMKDNRSATLLVDADNIPWVAWIAIQKTYSDVFWVRWNGVGWTAPVRANSDNNVPDINPRFTLQQSGSIILSWETYRDGGYVTESKMWNKGKRIFETTVSTVVSVHKKMRKGTQIPKLPAFIKEPHKATLFIRTEDGAEAVPLLRL